ncbi:MAG: methyl-accepting chemotaxis protein [Sedimentibacter sp.]
MKRLKGLPKSKKKQLFNFKGFKNLNISKKLIASFLIIAIIATIIGAVGMIGMQTISNADARLYELQTEPLIYLSYMLNSLNSMQLYLREGIISAGKLSAIEDSEEGFNEQLEVFKSSLEAYKLNLNAEDLDNIATIESMINNYYISNSEKAFSLARSGDLTGAYITTASISSSVDFIINYLNESLSSKVDSVKITSESNVNLAKTLSLVLIIVVIIGFIASIFIGIFMARAISNPVNKMVNAANRLAIGDTDINIDYDENSKDEISILAQSFDKVIEGIKEQVEIVLKIADGDMSFDVTPRSDKDIMEISLENTIERLNKILLEINEASMQVLEGSNQLSYGAQELSHGAAEQAGTIEELSASISEVSSLINSNGENVKLAEKYVKSAENEIIKSNEQMQEMLASMENINSSSKEIAKIIKVIDDIAFQTNILALNAAVEAARAGSAGKGFAVVADEVRNLASKCADAANQTTALIEKSIKTVQDGTIIAKDTAKYLEKVIEDTNLVAETMNKITEASNEQSSSINQINTGIEQISAVVQNNSAAAEESAAACEELTSQASALKEQISVFKLRNAVSSL